MTAEAAVSRLGSPAGAAVRRAVIALSLAGAVLLVGAVGSSAPSGGALTASALVMLAATALAVGRRDLLSVTALLSLLTPVPGRPTDTGIVHADIRQCDPDAPGRPRPRAPGDRTPVVGEWMH